jgi:hypothetical protein
MIAPLDYYLDRIEKETPGFKDDGLSCFPDWIYRYILRFNITPTGRVHDWHYCTRCHAQGTMTQARRLFADRALRQHAREVLPWYHPVAPIVLYRAVRWFGGDSAWNSCGPTRGERCRHNIAQPGWMRALG